MYYVYVAVNSHYFPQQWQTGGRCIRRGVFSERWTMNFYVLLRWMGASQPLIAETRVRTQARPCEISGGQSGTVTGFSPSTSAFPCQYHSIKAQNQFTHLPPTLYNVSLPVLQFSPVSTIPPMLHTHSFTYHPRYIMFLTQYFSFSLSVPFHQCSIPIHSPTTHTI